MAGHSKWKNIQRTKSVNDLARAKIFTKLARGIEVAAQTGSNPMQNSSLSDAIDRAKKANLPKDKIEKAIAKGAGNTKNSTILFEITYEAYAPSGLPILISCLTDNKNRSIAELRTFFDKRGGKILPTGSIAWKFETFGEVILKYENPEILLKITDIADILDFEELDDEINIITKPESLHVVKEEIDKIGDIEIVEARLIKKNKEPVDLSPKHQNEVQNFVDELTDMEDVVEVWI